MSKNDKNQAPPETQAPPPAPPANQPPDTNQTPPETQAPPPEPTEAEIIAQVNRDFAEKFKGFPDLEPIIFQYLDAGGRDGNNSELAVRLARTIKQAALQ